jgi:hypothetical protein
LVYYGGNRPWQNHSALLRVEPPDVTNGSFKTKMNKNWVAYIDPKTGQGVGVFSPYAHLFTSYRVGPDVGEPGSRPWICALRHS